MKDTCRESEREGGQSESPPTLARDGIDHHIPHQLKLCLVLVVMKPRCLVETDGSLHGLPCQHGSLMQQMIIHIKEILFLVP